MDNRRIIKPGFGLRNVDVLELTPQDSALDDEVRYQMSLLQLRPPLKNGMPVEMDRLQLRYHFAPQQALPTNRKLIHEKFDQNDDASFNPAGMAGLRSVSARRRQRAAHAH